MPYCAVRVSYPTSPSVCHSSTERFPPKGSYTEISAELVLKKKLTVSGSTRQKQRFLLSKLDTTRLVMQHSLY